MARIEVSAEIHKKVKAYAALKDLKMPDAYEELLEIALKAQKRR